MDGSDVEVLGAVVADVAVRLARRLDEQRHPVHLLAVGGRDTHPADVRRGEVGAVVGGDDEQRLRPRRRRLEVVDELPDERVGGTDLHAVQLVLHARAEVVAGSVRVGDQLGRERRPDSGPGQDPRPVRQGHVDDVQRG